MKFSPSYYLAGASPLPLDLGYLFLVESKILLVVQHQVVILDVSQEKIRAPPSTPPPCMIPITLNGIFPRDFLVPERIESRGRNGQH